jgi:hypothetical protein
VLEDFGTIISALIGAIGGSMGAVILTDLIKQRTERKTLRDRLINHYLIQLQDSIETLWYRLNNIKKDSIGQIVMDNEYYELSTLYSLACVLAYKRILMLDGIYIQLGNHFGMSLKQKMQDLDSQINELQFMSKFFHYDRLLLAESVIERENDRLRICSYLSFRKRYLEDEELKLLLGPAKEFILFIKGSNAVDSIMDKLMGILNLLKNAGISSNLIQR